MEANLQLIHFSFNQTPNMFYETKEFFKCSKGHSPNGEEHGHPILGLLPVRICILLPSPGNAEKLIFLDALFLLHPHSQGYLAHWDIPGHPSETSKRVTKGFKLWPKRAMRTLDVWSWSHIYKCYTKSRIYSLRWIWSYNSILCAGKKKIFFLFVCFTFINYHFIVDILFRPHLTSCLCSDTCKYKRDRSSLTETGEEVRNGA